MAKNKLTMAKLGKVTEMDRSFDLAYWQTQSSKARMEAIWAMTVFHHKIKKRDPNELRLDRTIESLEPREY